MQNLSKLEEPLVPPWSCTPNTDPLHEKHPFIPPFTFHVLSPLSDGGNSTLPIENQCEDDMFELTTLCLNDGEYGRIPEECHRAEIMKGDIWYVSILEASTWEYKKRIIWTMLKVSFLKDHRSHALMKNL